MKTIYLSIVLGLFFTEVLFSQNLDLFPEYKKVSQEEPIEVNGKELNFKVMNVCYEDILFALPATSNQGAKIISNYDFSTFNLIDTTISSNIINGIASYGIGYDFTLFFTTNNDTLYIRDYKFSQNLINIPEIETTIKTYIPNILTLFGNPNYLWVATKTNDTVSLISIVQNTMGIEFQDTILFPISTIEIAQHYDDNTQIVHFAGKDANNNLHYYRFDTYTKAYKEVVIDNFQEDILFIGGNDNKSVIISKNGNNLIAYESAIISSLYTTTSLGIYDSIISVSASFINDWSTNEIIVITKSNSQLIAKTFSFLGWANIDNFNLQVKAKNIYSNALWGMGQSGYVEYSDSTENIFLAPISSPFTVDTAKRFQIENSPSIHKRVSICFIGIKDKSLPEIKTYLYPNPATDDFTVVIKNVPCNIEHHLELYNLNGKKLYETPFYSKCELTVPIDNLPSGTYLLKLKINNKIYTRKILKG